MSRTRRPKPALTVAHLDDQSGGEIVDVIENVPAFVGATGDVASVHSSRAAFRFAATGFLEIIAKVDITVMNAKVGMLGHVPRKAEIVADHVGITVEEANQTRVYLNGLAETCAFMVAKYAARHGIPIHYENRASGPFAIVNGKLTPEAIETKTRGLPALGVAEIERAVSIWADAAATMASIVNAQPQVPAPAEEETEAATDVTAD